MDESEFPVIRNENDYNQLKKEVIMAKKKKKKKESTKNDNSWWNWKNSKRKD